MKKTQTQVKHDLSSTWKKGNQNNFLAPKLTIQLLSPGLYLPGVHDNPKEKNNDNLQTAIGAELTKTIRITSHLSYCIIMYGGGQ